MSDAKLAQAYDRAMDEIVKLDLEVARLEAENKQLQDEVKALNKAIVELDCQHASEIWWLRAVSLAGGIR